MNNIPRVVELVVKNDLCIGCGLCVDKCPSKALEMQWNEYGFLIPVQKDNCNDESSCLSVCPFNPLPKKEVETENELADIFLKDKTLYHPKIGKYKEIYAGYANEYRVTSSSGGVATFILTELLEQGIVNHILSVKESDKPNVNYEYTISNNKQELITASKTRYFPVTLATVFSEIKNLEGRVAIVGVACFIKAIRLAQFEDSILKEKIPFLVGIICGGIKSRFFTEYLANKAGVSKGFYYKPEFRIKDNNSTAGDYSFGCIDMKDQHFKSIKMRAVGEMWGSGLFKANACDFCDDVTTELADISVGDAWFDPYEKDWKGTNVIITRTDLATQLINKGISSRKIVFHELPIEKMILSQQGSYNHRQKGIYYRIKQIKKHGVLVPPKRQIHDVNLKFIFMLVQSLRMRIRRKSLEIWPMTTNHMYFDKKMKKDLGTLKFLTRVSHLNNHFFYYFKNWFKFI